MTNNVNSTVAEPLVKVNLLGLNVNSIEPENLVACVLEPGRTSSLTVTFVNPHSYWLYERNEDYRTNLGKCDFVFCDGNGLPWAASMLRLGKLRRISFDSTSLGPIVFDWAAQKPDVRIFLVGGKEGVASKAAQTLRERYPGLQIVGTSNGFFDQAADVWSEIKRKQANLVVCGMGAPRQEKFVIGLKAFGFVGLAFTCGGYLDQLGTGFQYYPKYVDSFNLRFLYRLIREPKRLWRRYLWEYRIFLFRIVDALANRVLRR